jgi:hypothetical protein
MSMFMLHCTSATAPDTELVLTPVQVEPVAEALVTLTCAAISMRHVPDPPPRPDAELMLTFPLGIPAGESYTTCG